MTEHTKALDEALVTKESIGSIFTSLLASVAADNEATFQSVKDQPVIQDLLVTLKLNDPEKFRFAMYYPFNKFVDGILAQEFGDNSEIRFLMKNVEYVNHHFRYFIEKHEGGASAADKTRMLLRTILKHFVTGERIIFDYNQKYTFHLPKKVFNDHGSIIEFFMAIQALHYGKPERYLKALMSIQEKAATHVE